MRSRPYRIGWDSHRNGIAAAEINNIELLADSDFNMGKSARFSLGHQQYAGIVILGIAHQCLDERTLEGLRDAIDPEAVFGTPWIKETAGRKSISERIRIAVGKYVMPDRA